MRARPAARVDIILDNAGLELFADLCLADGLLTRFGAGALRLHVKDHPFFVSDALAADVTLLRQRLAADEAPLRALAARLDEHFATGRLQLASHPAWTQPYSFWELPGDLLATLGGADLLISKGDANYRRWLGDRRWAPTDSLERHPLLRAGTAAAAAHPQVGGRRRSPPRRPRRPRGRGRLADLGPLWPGPVCDAHRRLTVSFCFPRTTE